MNFIRLRGYKVLNEGVKRWSFVKWLKMVGENIKFIFTRGLVTNSNVDYITEGREIRYTADKVLVNKDGTLQFVDYEKGASALMIDVYEGEERWGNTNADLFKELVVGGNSAVENIEIIQE